MKSIMRHFTKRDWFATAGAVVLIALSVWLELLMPDYMKDITELLITPARRSATCCGRAAKCCCALWRA